jgi:hypothetical protein
MTEQNTKLHDEPLGFASMVINNHHHSDKEPNSHTERSAVALTITTIRK